MSEVKRTSKLPPIVFEIFNAPEFKQAMNTLGDYFADCWEKSAHGYVNQGDDPRVFGRVGAFIQWVLSWNPPTRPDDPPYHVLYNDGIIFVGDPMYACMNVELPPTPEKPVRYWHMRIGWRFDQNWTETGGYIFDAAAKEVDHELIWK